MKTSGGTNILNNRGLAMLETLPILMVFLILLGYGIGFFTVVHTGVLNSIAARNYAFETFRNRSDLTLFRDERADGRVLSYQNIGVRYHAIGSENLATSNRGGNEQLATARPISFGLGTKPIKSSELDHNTKIYEIQGRNRSGVKASPAWVMVGYGICINAGCGDR